MYCMAITQWPGKCEAFDVNKITLGQEILMYFGYMIKTIR